MITRSPLHLMTDRVTVERPNWSLNAQGEPVNTWTAVLTDVPAAVQPLARGQAGGTVGPHPVPGGIQPGRQWQVFLPAELAVSDTDRLRWHTRTLQILSARPPGSPQPPGAVLTLITQEVVGG